MISVIIPVFNVERYLDECIQSVINQTYTDWECILVDDGSTDGSGDICDKWKEKDGRIHVVHQKNWGVSKARNRGMEEATGDFFAFVDADDWLSHDYLSEMVQTSADIVVSGYIVEQGDGCSRVCMPIESKVFSLEPKFVADFVELNQLFLFYAPWGKLYRRSIINGNFLRFPEGCSYGEDLQFNYSYLESVSSISQVPVANYHYRQMGTGTLSNARRPDSFFQDYAQWQMLRAFYEKHGLWLQLSKELLYKRLWGIVYDGIFSTKTPNKVVLNIPEIKELKDFQHVFHCSKWIKWCILHRIAFVFR